MTSEASEASGATGPAVGHLHVITPQRDPRRVLDLVDAALAGGAPTIQVRTKDGSDRDRLALVREVVSRTGRAGAQCIVNDRCDLALAAGADGVHLGADDLPVAAARSLLGSRSLVGATARNADDARRAQQDGASYVGVGPVYATASKVGLPDPLGPAGLARVVDAVDLPVIAIAGIDLHHVPDLSATGAHGAAVIGAIADAEDPEQSTRDFITAWATSEAGRS